MDKNDQLVNTPETNRKSEIQMLYDYDVKGRSSKVLLVDLGNVTRRSGDIDITATALQALFHQINTRSNEAYCDIADIQNTDGELRIKSGGYVHPGNTEHNLSPAEYDVVGFSIVNVNQTFDFFSTLTVAKIPIFANERTENDPIVVIGGASTINPVPFADFVDVVVMGEGEDAMLECTERIVQGKKDHLSRKEILYGLRDIKGVYIPTAPGEHIDFAEIIYKEDLYPPGSVMVVDGKASLVISRSCPHHCSFCRLSSSQEYQKKTFDQLIAHIEKLKAAGAREIAIVSASASAWRSDKKTINDLIAAIEERGMSARFMADRPEQKGFGNQKSVVLAPESSPELRKVTLEKTIKEAVLRNAITEATKRGVKKFTFYGIIGILGGDGKPGETEKDLLYFKELAKFTLDAAKQHAVEDVSVEFNVMPLMPSPHTTLETHAMVSWEVFQEKLAFLQQSVQGLPEVKAKTHLTELDFYLEAMLNRGTSDDGKLIFEAHKYAANLGISLLEALKAILQFTGKNISEYLSSRSLETLPYRMVQPVRKKFPAVKRIEAQLAAV